MFFSLTHIPQLSHYAWQIVYLIRAKNFSYECFEIAGCDISIVRKISLLFYILMFNPAHSCLRILIVRHKVPKIFFITSSIIRSYLHEQPLLRFTELYTYMDGLLLYIPFLLLITIVYLCLLWSWLKLLSLKWIFICMIRKNIYWSKLLRCFVYLYLYTFQ